jgi:hypothetical protein
VFAAHLTSTLRPFIACTRGLPHQPRFRDGLVLILPLLSHSTAMPAPRSLDSLPFDVFYQIATSLDDRDCINLSRTNRTLHDFMDSDLIARKTVEVRWSSRPSESRKPQSLKELSLGAKSRIAPMTNAPLRILYFTARRAGQPRPPRPAIVRLSGIALTSTTQSPPPPHIPSPS